MVSETIQPVIILIRTPQRSVERSPLSALMVLSSTISRSITESGVKKIIAIPFVSTEAEDVIRELKHIGSFFNRDDDPEGAYGIDEDEMNDAEVVAEYDVQTESFNMIEDGVNDGLDELFTACLDVTPFSKKDLVKIVKKYATKLDYGVKRLLNGNLVVRGEDDIDRVVRPYDVNDVASYLIPQLNLDDVENFDDLMLSLIGQENFDRLIEDSVDTYSDEMGMIRSVRDKQMSGEIDDDEVFFSTINIKKPTIH